MPRNITVTFADGSTHIYQNAPDDVTPEQITARAQQEFGQEVAALDGGRGQGETEPEGEPLRVDVPDTGEGYDPAGFSTEQLAEMERQGLALNPQTGLYERPEEAPQPEPTDDSALRGFGLGVGKVVDNLSLAALQIPGIEGAFNSLADFTGTIRPRDAIEANDTARADNSRTGWQTVGTIAGALPTLAMPGGGFTQGATAGALSTHARDFSGVLKDAAIGGTLGKAGDVAAGLIAPRVSKHIRTLVDEGVRVTPGDIAGQGGRLGQIFKSVEDVGARTPIAGAALRGAQDRAIVDLNRAAINRSLKPIGEVLPDANPAGHEAIAFAADRLKAAYSDVLPRLRGTLDGTFQRRINAIDARIGADLPAEYASKLDAVKVDLRNAFQRAGPNGAYSGRTLRDASERLEDVASAYRRSDDPYLRRVGDVAEQYRQQLHALARRQNPSQAARLRDIDKGYASLVRVERAALSSADGIFTPAQYRAATRMTDRSARRSSSARGRALDQDLATAADIVMTNRAATGGSKDINSLIALGGGAYAAATGNPIALAAGGALATGNLAYTRPAQAAARWLLARDSTPAAQNLAEIIRYGTRAVAPSAATSISAINE